MYSAHSHLYNPVVREEIDIAALTNLEQYLRQGFESEASSYSSGFPEVTAGIAGTSILHVIVSFSF